MKLLIQKTIDPDSDFFLRRNHSKNTGKKPQFPKVWFFLVMGLAGTIFFLSQGERSPIIEKDGKPDLAPWRKEKLEKELHQLDNAEVYALQADRPGVYPCFHCPGKAEIFLNFNEIWKYGVTTRGEGGRYPSGLPHPGLRYVVLFEGDIRECLRQEKTLIYQYALLPENLKRKKPLIRPPGNKIDH